MNNDENTLLTYKNIKLFIYIMLTCLIVGYIVFILFLPNRYQTTIHVVINNKDNNSIYKQQMVKNNLILTNTYSEFFKNNDILREISKRTNNKYSINDLKNKIIVTKREKSQVIDTYVQANNKKDVELISKILKDEVTKKIKKGDVIFLENSENHITKVLPNIHINLLITLLNGFLISIIILLMKERLNKSISNEVNVEKELGVPVLGCIPYINK
ncbi:Wzz/FepE/Etk N-terminal domain-containing protein [Staphylococcus hominis]|uniref:YveK family protein n=2 Tax=Staphylococcus hominis TaxID=1290 RepID=UPI00158E819D|nr:Wzz/FepE/Etk N-terminal domain-containing protein [Staphylococcus hominis]QKW66280.1 hypothetical protein FOC56_00675 [Staphylococcus hominis]